MKSLDANRLLGAGVRYVPVPAVVLLAVCMFQGPGKLAAQEAGFRIQVAATADHGGALALRAALAMKLEGDEAAYVVADGSLYKVRMGDFRTRAEAGLVLPTVRALGYGDAWVTADAIVTSVNAGGGGGLPGLALPRMPFVRIPIEETLPLSRSAPVEEEAVEKDPVNEESEVEDESVGEAIPDEQPAEIVVSSPVSTILEPVASPALIDRVLPFIGDNKVVVDGLISERAWKMSEAGESRSSGVRDGAPEAKVRFVHDDQAFYIATQIIHSDPDRIALFGQSSKAPGDEERVVVSLSRDGVLAVSFGVTLTGIRIEYRRDEAPKHDWTARTSVRSKGWDAEIRVPFELLNMEGDQDSEWDVAVRWEDPSGSRQDRRLSLPMEQFAMVFRSGGFDHFVVTPSFESSSGRAIGAPWERTLARAGGEISLSAGEEFSLEAVVHPYYLTARPDPARVNLTPYDGYFPETRTYFQELSSGAPAWGPRLFYSRRIGSAPIAAPTASAIETLVPTNVLGVGVVQGAKGDTEYSVVTAVTDRAVVRSSGLPTVSPDEISPQSLFGMGRVQRTLGQGGQIGVTVTALSRSLASDALLSGLMAKYATVGSVDLILPLGRIAEAQAFASFSRLSGTSQAMRGLQVGSGHYFQRPDADHVSVDETATSLSGYAAGFRLEGRNAGIRWLGLATAYSPGFDIRDAGYLPVGDRIEVKAGLGFGARRWVVGDLVRDPWSYPADARNGLDLEILSARNFGGLALGNAANVTGWARVGGVAFEGGLEYRPAGLNTALTRGGPVMATPAERSLVAGFLRQRRNSSFGLRGEFGADDLDGSLFAVSAFTSWNWAEKLGVSLEPGYRTRTNPRQFVLSIDGDAPATYGRRYVFSQLDYEEMFARVGLSVSPFRGLTVRGYVEPFISAGDHSGFGELTSPGSNDLLEYGASGSSLTVDADGSVSVAIGDDEFVIPAPGFAVRSLRTQVVVDWNWAGDGTVSVSWRQNRSGFENRFQTADFQSFRNTLDDLGRGLLAIRFAYRIGG